MAAITSAQSGNWSATATWTGGVVPVEGDTVTIQNTHTVTIDQDITVGADTTTAAINVAAGGKLEVLSTVAGNYTLTCKGDLVINGTLEIGTVANPIPSSRTFTIKLNYSATLLDGEYGLKCNAGSTITIQGASKTYDRTRLAANASAGATSLTTADSTAWVASDEIGIAGTVRAVGQFEKRTLSVDASGTTLTITAGLTNAHSGTSPNAAEIINLTRNIKITAYNTSFVGYVLIATTSIVDIDWCEFSYLGQDATNKRGIEITTTTGSCNIQNCALHDFEDHGIYILGGSVDNITISNNVLYNLASLIGNAAIIVVNATAGSLTFNNDWIIGVATSSTQGFDLNDIGVTLTNCIVANINGNGYQLTEANAALGTFNNNLAHGCLTGLAFSGTTNPMRNSTISNFTAQRCTAYGMNWDSPMREITINTATLRENATGNMRFASTNAAHVAGMTFLNITFASSADNAVVNHITIDAIAIIVGIRMETCTFDAVNRTGNDINIAAAALVQMVLNNCSFDTTKISSLSNAIPGSYIKAQRINTTDGNHQSLFFYGTVSRDATIFRTAAPSERLTPNNASNKLESGHKKIAIADGGTVTVYAFVRKSVAGDGAAYNGNQQRLIQKRNDSIGVTADTVLATAAAAAGSWELLSGTTATAADNGVAEFFIDCDGTTGWVNIDDWSAA